MRHYLIFLIVTVILGHHLSAQKSLIDSSVFGKWPSVRDPKIANDGRFISYIMDNQPVGNSTFVIQSNTGNWKKEFINISYADFTNDNRQAILKTENDSLCIYTLGTNMVEYIPYVSSYKLSTSTKYKWLCYKLKSAEGDVVILRNMLTNEERHFQSVSDYILNDNGNVLVLKTKLKDNSHALKWISLPIGTINTIWEGRAIESYSFSNSGNQFAFLAKNENDDQQKYVLYYYKQGQKEAVKLVSDSNLHNAQGLVLSNIAPKFNKKGNRIFIYLKKTEYSQLAKNAIDVDIWSYQDTKLQSQQLAELNRRKIFLTGINVEALFQEEKITNKRSMQDKSVANVVRLQYEDEEIVSDVFSGIGDFVLVRSRKGGGPMEYNWNPASFISFYIVSMVDGSKRLLKDSLTEVQGNYFLSPTAKYVIYFNRVERNYYSYELATGHIRNISKGITANLAEQDFDYPGAPPPVGIAGWIEHDKGILIYDNFDIWMIDPSGKRNPVNITNGYGLKQQIKFCLPNEGTEVKSNENLLLLAFDQRTKNNGFFRKLLGEKGDPKYLTMGPYIYSWKYITSFSPLKAKNADTWIVRRMSACETPNYYVTYNFKTFTSLTELRPNRNYNWLTAELVRWKTLSGNVSEGVLYKPDNFDPNKKYPIIFYFYEKLSQRLNEFNYPEASAGPINIPYLVSNGYLVFTPDIHYEIGNPGESAFNSVVSAARYLSKFSWIDSTKMGIQGHSFGGFEVHYIITRTSLFAAAASAAGPSDFISLYGSFRGVRGESGISQFIYETTQSRIGATLWQRPDLYIKNSPVLNADKISTPLLMMNNKGDGAVPFAQGIELFSALRRLGKRGWMLQYDNGEHSVSGVDALDYTIRIRQFFDHYLKNAPVPFWMSRGIPAINKGNEYGYAYDPFGNCGKDCRVCKGWNEKMKKDPVATLKEIEIKRKEEHWQ